MFDKILIANRGEIACRVIATARKLGVQTVAVYSDADVDAPHVTQADQSVRLGPAPVADSYLRGDLIIEAAKATGAQAIHPGYGFLSENPEFVEAVEDAGLVFIGPSPKAIRAMGLKDAAKVLMEKAGVPVVPGYHGADQAGLAERAADIGYPVLIKAVAGGGGKGMRRVDSAKDFDEALASAQAEAQTAFGNAAVLIEKFVATPRHIEVQIFGDGSQAVHLFERDCSLQRRHQKVIEEAPAPDMPEDVRASMCAAAVRAAEAIGYSGAGTVEFIADASNGLHVNGYWFMEMNTRLQVEHPVTEAITGIDLVEWQLRVASGEPLPRQQDQISLEGHAFEARLYAEDVPAGFLPATGILTHLEFPSDARIDSGVKTGSEISPWYDPMIAKVTTHGADRSDALRRLTKALETTEVAGCVTNLAFLQTLAADTDFVAGRVDTGLIERKSEKLCATPDPTPAQWLAAVLTATGLAEHQPEFTGFSLWGALWQKIVLNDKTSRYQVSAGSIVLELDGETFQATHSEDHWRHNGAPLPNACKSGRIITVFGPTPIRFECDDPFARGQISAGGNDVRAPMPGLVRDVVVEAGAKVEEGDRLAVLEAMKMEHVLRAPRAGIVASVATTKDAQVAAGDTLITLEVSE